MITLAGVPLLLPDKGGEIQAWLDAYLPLEGMRDQSQPVPLVSHRAKSRSGNRSGVGLPIPNYPPPPKPKINSLWWPTGASRWARGYFLATESILADVLEAIGGSNATKPLVLKDEGADVTITASVHLLPPRPITAWEPPANDPREKLWLLPVVDPRYYWQWKHTDSLEMDDEATWDSLFSDLGTRLGVSIAVDAFGGDYKLPDIEEITRRYENAALLLDAAAHSTGRRIVVGFDGSVKAQGFSAANTALGENLAEYALVAGGEIERNLAAVTPASVLVTFPFWRHYHPYTGGELFPVSINAEEGVSATPNTVKVIHSTAYADFTDGGSTPDNNTDLQALAEVIAADFYASLKHFDYSLPSLFDWTPTAFDDAVEFRFGSLREGDYEAYTRAKSRPYNFGDEEQLQQFEGMTCLEDTILCKATGDLEAGVVDADYQILDGNPVDNSDMEIDPLPPLHLGVVITSGKIFYSIWINNSWIAVPWECNATEE